MLPQRKVNINNKCFTVHKEEINKKRKKGIKEG
jgi:hypothetical protein